MNNFDYFIRVAGPLLISIFSVLLLVIIITIFIFQLKSDLVRGGRIKRYEKIRNKLKSTKNPFGGVEIDRWFSRRDYLCKFYFLNDMGIGILELMTNINSPDSIKKEFHLWKEFDYVPKMFFGTIQSEPMKFIMSAVGRANVPKEYIEDIDLMCIIKKNGGKFYIDMPYNKRKMLTKFLLVK